MNKELSTYIEKRYPRWLDYSLFHCTQAEIADEASDVLNEVVVALLEKDEVKLTRLYDTKKGQYRELDFYVLRMIKLNIYSPTSPYQNRYKPIPTADVNFSRLKIVDETDEDLDRSSIILEQMNKVRYILDDLNISEKARRIFEFKFFHGMSFSKWEGCESRKELYDTYSRVIQMIKDRLDGKTLI